MLTQQLPCPFYVWKTWCRAPGAVTAGAWPLSTGLSRCCWAGPSAPSEFPPLAPLAPEPGVG